MLEKFFFEIMLALIKDKTSSIDTIVYMLNEYPGYVHNAFVFLDENGGQHQIQTNLLSVAIKANRREVVHALIAVSTNKQFYIEKIEHPLIFAMLSNNKDILSDVVKYYDPNKKSILKFLINALTKHPVADFSLTILTYIKDIDVNGVHYKHTLLSAALSNMVFIHGKNSVEIIIHLLNEATDLNLIEQTVDRRNCLLKKLCVLAINEDKWLGAALLAANLGAKNYSRKTIIPRMGDDILSILCKKIAFLQAQDNREDSDVKKIDRCKKMISTIIYEHTKHKWPLVHKNHLKTEPTSKLFRKTKASNNADKERITKLLPDLMNAGLLLSAVKNILPCFER